MGMKATDVLRAHIEDLKREIRVTNDDLTSVGGRQQRLAQRTAELRADLADAEAALRTLQDEVGRSGGTRA